MTENFVRETAVKELMTAIRRNTCPSKCVDTVDALLNEIQDVDVIQTVCNEVSNLMTGMMTLFSAVDNVGSDRPEIISKMLSDYFVNPGKYFKNSEKLTKDYLRLSYTMNTIKFSKGKYSFKDGFEDKVTKFNFGKNNKLGNVQNYSTYYIIPNDFDQVDYERNWWSGKYELTKDNFDDIQEQCRKVILLWNHLPAIYKAMMQTKRRKMGLDRNSKKFI